ncbi:MAG TPA: redoxin domain-containing protein [Nitrospirae bacterium]|nr:lipoprotein NlpI precursor [bacterium BMS3Abin09]GBE41706.1 lipoprotein NlpI precursor [bacterium BMS3Bbin09]HDH34868.1 redoxin domain-containing protein [Nitrospirota bacterium]HDO67637.1 redoxin domain-containing protein [Nitrospirota bacterium]HDZ84369.1 redoxin domain-containing protein [Nitrospirota bacterium]
MNKDIKMHRRSLSLIIIPLLIIASIFLMPQDSSALIGLDEGDLPKDIILSDLNGVPVNVTKYFGKKPVIIVFWEKNMSKSFINYSLDVMRFLNGKYATYHESKGLEVFGIYTPEEEKEIPPAEFDNVRSIVQMNDIKFPVLMDRGFGIFREYGVVALPSTVMINMNGKIEFIYPSFPLVAKKVFIENIEKLVGIEKPVVKAEKEEKESDTKARRLYHYALQMYKKGLLEQARSPLEKSIALEPGIAWSHNLMGIILWKSGSFDGAVKEFKEAIRLDRRSSYAHFNYGLILFENNRLNEAEKQLDISLAIDKSAAETHYVLGMLYKKKKMPDEALKELEIALSIYEEKNMAALVYDPASFHMISVYYVLSELYAEKGDFMTSRELLLKATRAALGIDGEEGRKPVYRSEDLMIYE